MRLLLDECLPKRLKAALRNDYEVTTVQEAGWAGLSDGELLDAARDRFDLLLTTDRNLRYQQCLDNGSLSIVVLVAPSSRMDDLLPLTPHLKSAVSQLSRGEAVCVDREGLMPDE